MLETILENPITAIGDTGIKVARDFDLTLAKIQARTGATPEVMAQIRQKALQIGQDTSFSAGEAAENILLSLMAPKPIFVIEQIRDCLTLIESTANRPLLVNNWQVIIHPDDSGDKLYRLRMFVDWLNMTGGNWHNPSLSAYRDFLMSEQRTRYMRDRRTGEITGSEPVSPLSPSSCHIYLSTIRGRYNELLKSNQIRDNLYQMIPAEATPADKKAFVDEILERLRNVVDPDTAKVKVEKVQDVADDKQLRLSRAQASALIHAPFVQDGNKPLMAIRNAAMIALMLCTGIREMELCNLTVADLRKSLGGELALRVRKGKGCKTRMIPYGDMDICLPVVDTWLNNAGIKSGPVFRGFDTKDGKQLRKTRIHVRAINQVLERYKISVNGRLTKVNPTDLRRTYARRSYDEGHDILAIQQNLGHASYKTTLIYIGASDGKTRRTRDLYDIDLSHLNRFE